MQDMKEFRLNIKTWIKAFPFITEKVNKKFGPTLISDIRRDSLSGQVLKRQSGELQKSIKTIFKTDKNVHMFIGTDVLSPKGFGYGAYWFNRGRDFLNPSIDKNMDKYTGALADGIEREFVKVVR